MNEALLRDLLNRILDGNVSGNRLIAHAKRVQRYLDTKAEVKAFEHMFRAEFEREQPVDCDIGRTVELNYPLPNGK